MRQSMTRTPQAFLPLGHQSDRPFAPYRAVCTECQHVVMPLYRMNGQHYCELCLLAWCLSLPEVHADLLADHRQEA